MSDQQQGPIPPGTVSPDGQHVWDGYQWWDAASVPIGTSLDGGRTTWDGRGWAPAQPAFPAPTGGQFQPQPPQSVWAPQPGPEQPGPPGGLVPPAQPCPGDVVNGQILGQDGHTWYPISPSSSEVAEPPRKKRRPIFIWVFLAIQILFILWIVVGTSSAGSSAKDCGTLSQETCDTATAVGTGIGVALVIGLWVVTDIILGISYGIYRLARR